ncbi:hypothetical protein HF668_01835 [Acidithiobacillus ferridurans]|uniref:hypothetical protein n=1 Tax=Acidithiobacillus ferridurans TaxID=1232575 RepID=UPI001C0716FA|nr:hypothetical protein [Acidithiobacillus ferridurans]MBU2803922.1 hypothetical protein [Acidithiobacillus ferridurans]
MLPDIEGIALFGLLISVPDAVNPWPWFQNIRQSMEVSHVSDTISRAEVKLIQIAALPDDWDGYGAECISEAAIRNTKAILPFLAENPDILESAEFIPNPYGTLSLLWEKGGETAHLEIGTSRFSFYGPGLECGGPLKLEGAVGNMSRNVLDSLTALWGIKWEGESNSLTLAA